VIEAPVAEIVVDNKEPVIEEALPELIKEEIKAIQKNKGRCFSCRSKVIMNYNNKATILSTMLFTYTIYRSHSQSS
jgi:hypothetical protein